MIATETMIRILEEHGNCIRELFLPPDKGNAVKKITGNGQKQIQSAPVRTHDLRILDAIRRVIRAVDIDSRRLAETHSITAPQLLALMAAIETSPITAHEVAKRIHASTTTLVGVLDRLEEKGLIQRKRNQADRREVEIVPTEAGRRVVAATPFPLQHVLERALSQLKKVEREELAGWMERLVDLMEIAELDDGPMLEFRSIR